MAEALDAVLALFRSLRWDGRALLTGILDRLQGRAGPQVVVNQQAAQAAP